MHAVAHGKKSTTQFSTFLSSKTIVITPSIRTAEQKFDIDQQMFLK